MIELNIAYLKYINESKFWGLKLADSQNEDLDDFMHGNRLLEAEYFLQDVIPKIKHAGIEWLEVTAENTMECVIQIHQLLMKAATDLGRDPYLLLDNFFETQTHVPKKDLYILIQLRDVIERRIENIPIGQATGIPEAVGATEV